MVLLCMPVTWQQVLGFPLWVPAFGLPSTLPQPVPCYANEPFVQQSTASPLCLGRVLEAPETFLADTEACLLGMHASRLPS